MLKQNCLQCSAEFSPRPYQLKVGTGKFCSRQCTAIFHGSKRTRNPDKWKRLNCFTCGKLLNLPTWRSNAKYCSHTCRNKSPIKATRKDKNHWNYKNGIGNYRKRALECYGRRCEICGSHGPRLVVHHRDENRSNNRIENLQVLCSRCHTITHRSGDRFIIGILRLLKQEGRLKAILDQV